MLKRILVISIGLAASSVPAAAQSRSFAGCWLRPAPAPTCSDFLVTEASAEFRLNQRENYSNPRYVLGLGFMHNINASSSAGAVVAWDVGRGWAKPARGEMRYRKWLSNGALDFAGGVAQRGITASDGSGREIRAYGPTVMVGAEWKYIAVDVRDDFLTGDKRTFNDVYVGARTTSIGAPIAVLAGLAFIVAVVSQVGY